MNFLSLIFNMRDGVKRGFGKAVEANGINKGLFLSPISDIYFSKCFEVGVGEGT